MATVTTHTLNSVHGTHAGGIAVSLLRISHDGKRDVVFESETDAGGRLSKIVEIASQQKRAYPEHYTQPPKNRVKLSR